jgi:branched-chain amino acid transport system ATP-binding protein
MLKITDLTVKYEKVVALNKVSICIEKGELVAVLGANGAGKTTLAKSILGLVNIESGEINFNKEDITQIKAYQRAKKGIGFIPEGSRIFPQLTIDENLMIGAFSRNDKETIEKDKEYVYKLFPVLRERKKVLASTFSGGQRQMLSIARGFMVKPKLLVVDEMSIGLMPVLVKELFGLLKHFTEQGISILLIEQNAKQALKISDRGYILKNGEITLEGDSKSLSDNEEVRKSYLGI